MELPCSRQLFRSAGLELLFPRVTGERVPAPRSSWECLPGAESPPDPSTGLQKAVPKHNSGCEAAGFHLVPVSSGVCYLGCSQVLRTFNEVYHTEVTAVSRQAEHENPHVFPDHDITSQLG